MSTDIYDRIIQLIAEGHYIGGDVLPEVELADRLGVSRTPIREALQRLEAEGMAVRRDNRRVYLKETNSATFVEIFTLRAALEPVAARIAAGRVTPLFLDRMSDLIAQMDAAQMQTPPDLRRYRELNAAFHGEILTLSGNAMLGTTVRTVARAPVVSPTFNFWDQHELKRSQHHHHELLAAFRAGDEDWAEAIMRSHMLAARAVFTRLLSES